MVSAEAVAKLSQAPVKIRSVGDVLASLLLSNIKSEHTLIRIPNDYLTPLGLPGMSRETKNADDSALNCKVHSLP